MRRVGAYVPSKHLREVSQFLAYLRILTYILLCIWSSFRCNFNLGDFERYPGDELYQPTGRTIVKRRKDFRNE